MWPFNKKQKSDQIDKKRLEAFGLLAAVSSLCIGPERIPVMHGIKETPNNVSDSGWILSSGRESNEFSSDAKNYKLVLLERMIDSEPTLAPLLDFPVGTEVVRSKITEAWRFIVDGKVIDDDGKVVGGIRE